MSGAAGEPMDTTLTLRIQNDLAGLARLLERATAFLAGHGAAPGVAYKVELALEELVTNTIKYGYADGERHEIEATLVWDPPRVVLRLADDGRPFDPLAAPPPDLDAPLEARPVGGLGLHLIRRMAEGVAYCRTGGRNRLELHFRLPA